jgi:hypothetical protein
LSLIVLLRSSVPPTFVLEEPETGEIKVKQMEVDDEARRLADEVMKAYEVVEP